MISRKIKKQFQCFHDSDEKKALLVTEAHKLWIIYILSAEP